MAFFVLLCALSEDNFLFFLTIAFAIYSAQLQNLGNFEMQKLRISLRMSAFYVDGDLSTFAGNS